MIIDVEINKEINNVNVEVQKIELNIETIFNLNPIYIFSSIIKQ